MKAPTQLRANSSLKRHLLRELEIHINKLKSQGFTSEILLNRR